MIGGEKDGGLDEMSRFFWARKSRMDTCEVVRLWDKRREINATSAKGENYRQREEMGWCYYVLGGIVIWS